MKESWSNMMNRRILGSILALFLFASMLLPAPLLAQSGAACARDVTVQPGDTLTELASRYLGDPLAYNRIIAATNARARSDSTYTGITNEASIRIGWKLCVPAKLGPTSLAAPAETVPSSGGQVELAESDALTDTVVFDGQRLTIDYLRQQETPGSKIVIEETLAPGANYDRYLVSYQSEGLRIYSLMTIPQGEKPATGWPVIVFNHGYIPPEVYRTTERYVAYVDGFARAGYIVFRPDYRGHGFSDGEARGAYGTPDYVLDVMNAVASIKRHPDADPNRIGMWGHSMGGYITLRLMVATDDVKAGVIWAGVVASYPDLIERWNRRTTDIPNSARRWRTQLLDQYGAPAENPDFWNSISANSYLADLSGPLQIHHGTADETVPIEFSVKLFDQIKAVEGDAEIFTYLDDDHNIVASFDTAMARSVAFFDRTVKGEQ